MAVKSHDLRLMTKSERERVLSQEMASPDANVATWSVVIHARLRMFESRYNLSTADLPDALASNRIQETPEICEWLFWSGIQARLGSPRA